MKKHLLGYPKWALFFCHIGIHTWMKNIRDKIYSEDQGVNVRNPEERIDIFKLSQTTITREYP